MTLEWIELTARMLVGHSGDVKDLEGSDHVVAEKDSFSNSILNSNSEPHLSPYPKCLLASPKPMLCF